MNSTPDTTAGSIALAPEAFSLAGRHIVVTGAGRGLGQGIAVSAGLSGARVTLLSRSVDELEQTADMIRAAGADAQVYPVDLTDTAALNGHAAEIHARFGVIDGVAHAAGVQVREEAVELSLEDWRFVQRINIDAPYFLSIAIARTQLREGRRGSHIFIGSLNSSIGLARVSAYATSKTALLGAARSLSTEWSGRGVRVNVIGPGYFHTALTEGLLSNPEDHTRILGRIPMGALGTPADIGGAAVFLLSDASRYISGQLLNVDGGWLAS